MGTTETETLLKKFNHWKWFTYLNTEHKYELNKTTIYNELKLRNLVDNMNISEEGARDANIIYSDSENKYIIEPEVYGINISENEMFELIKTAIDNKDSELIVDEFIVQPEITSNDTELIKLKDEANSYLDVVIRYDFGDREYV